MTAKPAATAWRSTRLKSRPRHNAEVLVFTVNNDLPSVYAVHACVWDNNQKDWMVAQKASIESLLRCKVVYWALIHPPALARRITRIFNRALDRKAS